MKLVKKVEYDFMTYLFQIIQTRLKSSHILGKILYKHDVHALYNTTYKILSLFFRHLSKYLTRDNSRNVRKRIKMQTRKSLVEWLRTTPENNNSDLLRGVCVCVREREREIVCYWWCGEPCLTHES